MPLVQKPILHGRDHGCGGADPIPGICDLASLIGTVSEAILATEPGAYYKLDETTGGWADSSGAGRDLTHNSRTGEVRGVDSALDEGDGSLCVGVHGPTPGPTLDPSDIGSRSDAFFQFDDVESFSVTVRIRPASLPTGAFSMGICGNAADAGGIQGWGLFLHRDPSGSAPGGYPLFRRAGGGADQDAEGAVPLIADEWVRLTATFDGTTSILYADDVELDSNSSSPPTLPGGTDGLVLRVGCCGIMEGIGGTQAPFDGEIDSLAVWDRALSPGEVGGIIDAETSSGGISPSGAAGGDLGGSYPNPSIASGAVTSSKIADGTIVNADVAASADIAPTKLSHPGGTSTFLRADGSWAAPTASSDPATDTKVWMPLFDSDGALVLDDDDELIPTLIAI